LIAYGQDNVELQGLLRREPADGMRLPIEDHSTHMTR
jgi:hypothetical protein